MIADLDVNQLQKQLSYKGACQLKVVDEPLVQLKGRCGGATLEIMRQYIEHQSKPLTT